MQVGRPYQAVRRTGLVAATKGAVTARAHRTNASPRYSVSSNGPMAFTIQSYRMADTSAMVLLASNVHQAQRSPRRKAVTAMRLPINPNTAQWMPDGNDQSDDATALSETV